MALSGDAPRNFPRLGRQHTPAMPREKVELRGTPQGLVGQSVSRARTIVVTTFPMFSRHVLYRELDKFSYGYSAEPPCLNQLCASMAVTVSIARWSSLSRVSHMRAFAARKTVLT
jgi:hypothetical protein